MKDYDARNDLELNSDSKTFMLKKNTMDFKLSRSNSSNPMLDKLDRHNSLDVNKMQKQKNKGKASCFMKYGLAENELEDTDCQIQTPKYKLDRIEESDENDGKDNSDKNEDIVEDSVNLKELGYFSDSKDTGSENITPRPILVQNDSPRDETDELKVRKWQ